MSNAMIDITVVIDRMRNLRYIYLKYKDVFMRE